MNDTSHHRRHSGGPTVSAAVATAPAVAELAALASGELAYMIDEAHAGQDRYRYGSRNWQAAERRIQTLQCAFKAALAREDARSY
jgi:hypothetical protein